MRILRIIHDLYKPFTDFLSSVSFPPDSDVAAAPFVKCIDIHASLARAIMPTRTHTKSKVVYACLHIAAPSCIHHYQAKQNKYFVSCNMLGKKEGQTVGFFFNFKEKFYNLSETKTNLNSHNNL